MQNKILDYFTLLKKNSILGSSYLFVGNNKEQVIEILKLVNCNESESYCNSCWECKRIEALNHPDLFMVEPDPHMIKIEKIREAIQFLSLKAFRAERKLLFISGAENFGNEAANAFLKTLEEAPKHSFIAVYSSKLEGLLPTIVSRCRKVFLTPKEIEAGARSLLQVEDFFKGIYTDFKDRAQFGQFLLTLIMLVRDELVKKSASINNRLLTKSGYAIMPGSYDKNTLVLILEDLIKIYGAHTNINENLALTLIRMKLS